MGETLAIIATLGELVYTKAVLKQLIGTRIHKIPTLVITDSKNLEEAIYSTSLMEDCSDVCKRSEASWM